MNFADIVKNGHPKHSLQKYCKLIQKYCKVLSQELRAELHNFSLYYGQQWNWQGIWGIRGWDENQKKEQKAVEKESLNQLKHKDTIDGGYVILIWMLNVSNFQPLSHMENGGYEFFRKTYKKTREVLTKTLI